MSAECTSQRCCQSDFGYSPTNPPAYFNTEQSFTPECPEGYTCESVAEVTVPAGTYSAPTQEEADAIAQQAAQNEAWSNLHPTANLFYNTEQTFECEAPNACGTDGVQPANTTASIIDQAAANAEALALAEADSDCEPSFENEEYTLTCGCGQTGSPVTIPAGTYVSCVSQADADAQAVAAAQAAISCSGSPTRNFTGNNIAVRTIGPTTGIAVVGDGYMRKLSTTGVDLGFFNEPSNYPQSVAITPSGYYGYARSDLPAGFGDQVKMFDGCTQIWAASVGGGFSAFAVCLFSDDASTYLLCNGGNSYDGVSISTSAIVEIDEATGSYISHIDLSVSVSEVRKLASGQFVATNGVSVYGISSTGVTLWTVTPVQTGAGTYVIRDFNIDAAGHVYVIGERQNAAGGGTLAWGAYTLNLLLATAKGFAVRITAGTVDWMAVLENVPGPFTAGGYGICECSGTVVALGLISNQCNIWPISGGGSLGSPTSFTPPGTVSGWTLRRARDLGNGSFVFTGHISNGPYAAFCYTNGGAQVWTDT